MLRAATKSTPVPCTFFTTTWPTRTGAVRVTSSSRAMALKISPLGMGPLVFTGQRGWAPPSQRTVEVSTRVGWVSSVLPYSAPRGQPLPVTA